MNHWIYFTKQPTGTVHLARFDDAERPGVRAKTLCGQSVNGLVEGDETMSGIAATCGTCRRRAGRS